MNKKAYIQNNIGTAHPQPVINFSYGYPRVTGYTDSNRTVPYGRYIDEPHEPAGISRLLAAKALMDAREKEVEEKPDNKVAPLLGAVAGAGLGAAVPVRYGWAPASLGAFLGAAGANKLFNK